MSSAAFAYPQKSAEAFRTISEVSIELDVPQHVLRFWESRFVQIKPLKRAGGRRYYRPDDVDLLKGIRALLYKEGLTIRGVQKVLKERGLRHVADLGRGIVAEPSPQVIEKIVYVEKPMALPKKSRATHLRAVPDTLVLPFFDLASEKPSLEDDPAFAPIAVAVVDEASATSDDTVEFAPYDGQEMSGHTDPDRQRLEKLLDELNGLKARLQVARERVQA